MIVSVSLARLKQASPEYIAYRDRVVADKGTVASSTATQNGLDVLAGTPSITQWLDSRFGTGTDAQSASNGRVWYSITPNADAHLSVYGAPIYGIEATFNYPVWARGSFVAGLVPALGPTDSYTWGMYFTQVGAQANGFLWGDRYNTVAGGDNNGWTWLQPGYWRCYSYGNDRAIAGWSLPIDTWLWVWVVKDGTTVTGYDGTGAVLFTTDVPYTIVAQSCGIAGSSDSVAVSSNIRYRTFIRAARALTLAERNAIQVV